MKFPELFSNKNLPAKARRVVAFSLCMTFAPSLALANGNGNETKKPSARPVARLLSTSREEVPTRARARMVSGYNTSAPSASAASARPSAASAVAAPTGSERRLFEMINDERRSRGRSPLAWDGELTRLARYHSENMGRQNFFNHVDREGRDTTGRAQMLGVRGWRALAENIAYNQGYDDPEAFAVERWMISAKHRDNILNGEFTHAGLGVYRAADGRAYFTQVFMKR